MTGRNLVVAGGPLHDFAATTDGLVALAAAEGLASTLPTDPTAALDLLVDERWDLLTVDALLWTMPAERHAPLRDEWRFELADRHADALVAHVEGGGALLAVHTAPICFDGDARWRRLLGATWDWERSHHPPLGPVAVRRTAVGGTHRITASTDAFELIDEVYADLEVDDDVEPLLVSPVGGVDQPVLWARRVGRGRVVVDLLGHHRPSLDHPDHATVLRRALRWLVAPSSPAPEAQP
ncbi:MAG: ThuA domain-containing protein [Acidimicrobiales bacterium]